MTKLKPAGRKIAAPGSLSTDKFNLAFFAPRFWAAPPVSRSFLFLESRIFILNQLGQAAIRHTR